MALVVWLPLISNVENKGASAVTITNNGAAANTNGKIGSCYAFNGSTAYISLSGSELFRLFTGGSQQFSIAMWLYHADTTRAILFGDYSTSGAINFNIELNTSHGVRFYWAGSPDTTFANSSVGASTWTHMVLTYDGTKIQSYINGVAKGSWSGTLGAKNKTTGEFRLGRDSRSDSTAFNGRMNDVRIYNHALSAAEVHEISQGLVLHYKLDDTIGFTDLIARNANVNAYNNHGNTNNPTTVTYLSEQYNGDRIIQYSATPTSNAINSIQTTLSSHGIYNWSRTFKANTKYVFWIYYKPITHLDTRVGGTASNIGGWTEIPPVAVGGGWYRVGQYRNGSVTTDKTDNIFVSYKTPSAVAGQNIIIYFASPHLIEGTTEIPPYDYPSTIIQDSSGYGHNGTITGNIIIDSSTPRYSMSTKFPDSTCSIGIGNLSTIIPEGIFTFNIWFKKITGEWSSKTWETILGGPGGFEFEGKLAGSQNAYVHPYSWGGGSTSSPNSYSIAYTLDTWHMVTMVRTTANTQFYLDGELKVTGSAGSIPSGNYFIGAWNSATQQNYRGYFSDARIYCTALSAEDVKQLYEMGAKVDNKGNWHTYEFIESANNIFQKVEEARAQLAFENGLGKYTQSNCQVTLTNQGFRIYRPPNLTTASNGNSMWGGLKLINQTTDTVSPYNASRDNIWGLQTGHTYLIAFHAKGQSSNAHNTFGWINNMGWGVGGVAPAPSNVISNGIPSNFNGEKDCHYIFTINDNIVKTSNDARGGYDGSSQYLSYRHFALHWAYTNTGELGTDIYLTNFRLYDITDAIGKITKRGQSQFTGLIEQLDKTQLRKKVELLSSEFIEI